MPNWCDNEIEIMGSDTDIKKLVDTIQTDNNMFDFNTIIPYPEEYRKLDEDYKNGLSEKDGYNQGGYDWCIKNWGTKWNIDDAFISFEPNRITIAFQTAWSPSTNVTKKLASMFPDLYFEHHYEEGGCDFSGIDVFENGKNTLSLCGDYESYPIGEHEDYDDEEEGE